MSFSPSPSPSPSISYTGNATSTDPSTSTSSCFDGRCLPEWFPLCLGSVLLVGGLILSLAGYRFFRQTLLILGGAAAGIPVWILSWDHGNALFSNISSDGLLGFGIGVGSLSGLLGAFFCWRFFRVGVFMIGALLGVLIALILNLAVFVHLVPAAQANTPFIAGGVILGAGFGALALRFMRPTVIISTSTIGAYAAIRSIGLFVGNYPNEFNLAAQLEAGQSLSMQVYGYLAGIAVLAIIGTIVQIRFTAPKVKEGEKDENEIAFDEAESDFGKLGFNHTHNMYTTVYHH
jgi:hypothetical protein